MTEHSFPNASIDQWRKRVEEELGDAPLSELAVVLREGIEVQPLYSECSGDHRLERVSETPGLALFVSGRDGKLVERAQRAARNGADHLWIMPSPGGAGPQVVKDLVVASGDDLGLEITAWQEAAELHQALRDAGANGQRQWLALDPLGGRGRLSMAPEPGALDVYRHHRNDCQLVISTMPFHSAGADAADEIAISMAIAIEVARWLEGGAWGRVTARVAVRPDVFIGIAKLRALRLCFSKLAAATGLELDLQIHAVSSPRVHSLLDPWMNVLRGAAGGMAAILGGAERVTLLRHDRRAGKSELGDRLARNAYQILVHEAKVHHISDPAHGAYYIESMTDELARVAWQRMQEIERRGGLPAVLESGWLSAVLRDRHDELLARLSRRDERRIGVNTFAVRSDFVEGDAGGQSKLSDYSFDDIVFAGFRRRSAALERRGAKATAFLVALAEGEGARERLDFARDVLAAAGISLTVPDANYAADHTTLSADFAASGCVAVCLCGDDASYRGLAATVNQALPAQAVRMVVGGDSMAGFHRLRDGHDVALVIDDVLTLCEVAAQ